MNELSINLQLEMAVAAAVFEKLFKNPPHSMLRKKT